MELITIEQIETRALEITGLSIQDLVGGVEINKRDKGSLGNIIQEKGFFIKKNNDSAPDFKTAGVELKVVPLERYKRSELYRIKERTKVCSIDYPKLVEQRWPSSKAKDKLNQVLFVFFEYNKAVPEKSQILKHLFYYLTDNPTDEIILSGDWKKVKSHVDKGEAHQLSDRLTKVLAATRSGAGKGRDLVIQPNSPVKAPKRAFTLKASFTKVLWHQLNGKKYNSIDERYEVKKATDIEDILLSYARKLEGLSLSRISHKYKIAIPSGKSAAATLVRAALGYKGKFKPIKEIEQLGLLLKTVPVNSTNDTPWEALSFSYQPLMEIANEESYQKSELLENLNGLLIIPIYRPARTAVSPHEQIVGRAFIWRPSSIENIIIEKEWNLYKKTIQNGVTSTRIKVDSAKGYRVETNLPKESQTEIIHIRPHARDGRDLDPSLLAELEISKQSFWLNKMKLKQLIAKNSH